MKYPSKYSNGKDITAAQFITEMICENKAKNSNTDLHYKFWLNKQWAAFYKDQIATAYKLLKKYDEKAVIKALSSPEAVKIYSLRSPILPTLIKQQTDILNTKSIYFDKKIDRKENKTFGQVRSSKSHRNILNKLKEIDNDS